MTGTTCVSRQNFVSGTSAGFKNSFDRSSPMKTHTFSSIVGAFRSVVFGSAAVSQHATIASAGISRWSANTRCASWPSKTALASAAIVVESDVPCATHAAGGVTCGFLQRSAFDDAAALLAQADCDVVVLTSIFEAYDKLVQPKEDVQLSDAERRCWQRLLRPSRACFAPPPPSACQSRGRWGGPRAWWWVVG